MTMNRTQRRAASAQQRKRESLHRHLEALHNEAAGVLGVYLVSPENILGWMLVGHSGDEMAVNMVKAVGRCLRELDEQKPLCLTCDFEFSSSSEPPSIFAVVVPGRDNPAALLWMLCSDCVAKHAGNLADVLEQSARKIWPKARRLDMVNFAEGGRA
jgi:hypothetical protein